MCQAIQEMLLDERTEGLEEGIAKGADMLANLLKKLTPGSKEFEKALNATEAERKKMYKKYGIID